MGLIPWRCAVPASTSQNKPINHTLHPISQLTSFHTKKDIQYWNIMDKNYNIIASKKMPKICKLPKFRKLLKIHKFGRV